METVTRLNAYKSHFWAEMKSSLMNRASLNAANLCHFSTQKFSDFVELQDTKQRQEKEFCMRYLENLLKLDYYTNLHSG